MLAIEVQSGDCNFLRMDYSAQQTVFFYNRHN
jgi:hypothetical protein